MTRTILTNARIVDPSQNMDETGAVIIEDGKIAAIGATAANDLPSEGDIQDLQGQLVIPGLIDTCVHIGEPGGEHRETIASASKAAAAGGVTGLIMMPDTNPVIDDVALVDFVQRAARDEAIVSIYPAAALTKGLDGEQMTEFGLLLDAGAKVLTNGRKTVKNTLVMRRAMTYARDFGAVVACATQDAYLSGGGVMNEGLFASWLGLPGIPREAEIIPLERDLRLAALTGARYHALKLSVPESADAIRAAKAAGHSVTAGMSINHLTLNETDIGEYRTFFRLSPPLRTEDDRVAMVAALADGTIDIISSAHDPQDVDTKRLPFADAAPGMAGAETLLALSLNLVREGHVSINRLMTLLCANPAKILGVDAGSFAPGSAADLILVDPDAPWIVDSSRMAASAGNTPFDKVPVQGRARRVMKGGAFL